MSQISFDNITVLIVTYKSSKVIFKCLDSLRKIKKILILDNSNDKILKNKIKNYNKNIKIFLSPQNLGYAKGNNILLKYVKTKYALIINPDCFLKKNSLSEIDKFIKNNIPNWAILGLTSQAKTIGYIKTDNQTLFECEYVKGFFLLLNLELVKKINFFDKNFFLYLEEIDLCKRLLGQGLKVLATEKIKFFHSGGRSSQDRKEFKKLRNWHWMWSQFYFCKKHYGHIFAYTKFFPKLIYLYLKKLIIKNEINKLRFDGLCSSMLNKKSYFRN